MHDPDSFDMSEHDQDSNAAPHLVAPRPRIVGSPLSTGVRRHGPYPAAEGGVKQLAAPPQPRRAPSSAPPANDQPSGLHRAVSAFRSALPLVQRLLPLLDGNIASTVGNLLAPRPHPQAPPSAKIDLEPIEEGLADLRTQQERLRDQVAEQNNSFKRVADQLDMVREATDRNTLEQQELLEDLKSFGKKVKFVAILGLLLLAAGIAMTVVVFMHIRRVLP